MSTLAEKFHDSFDAYYAGKKSGWTAEKSAPQPKGPDQPPEKQQQDGAEQAAPESRH